MSPSRENALLHHAISLAQSGRTEEAHALFHKIASDNPTQEMAWLWLVQTESDPEQRIHLLEECLRHNPNSELAKKGLNRLRARSGADSPQPPKPPDKKPPPLLKKNAKPRRRSGCRLRTVLILAAFGSGAALCLAAVLFYPQWTAYFPSLNLPEDPLALLQGIGASATPFPSSTATTTRTATGTATLTFTPTVTSSPTVTDTPTATFTPTLFAGEPEENEPALLFLAAGGCEALRIPVSGGEPESQTATIPPDCSLPEISPDGKKIAYVSQPEGNTIQTVNIDGSWKRMVTKLAASTGAGRTIWAFEWSPDAQKIAYAASAYTKDPLEVSETSAFLYTVALSSGYATEMKALGIEAPLADRIAWSPDGIWVFAFDMGNPLETDSFPYAFRASDSRTVWIAREDPYLGHYDWSPDSLFLSSVVPEKPDNGALPADAPEDQNYIVIFGLDESRYYVALEEKGYDPVFGARWFPDRSAFLLFRLTTGVLAVITTEGEYRNTVAALEQAPSFVSFSPDGEWIALVERSSSEETGGTLMVVRPDGTDLRILARGVGDAPPVWV
ncbi:MAG: hypothetical protein ACK2UB_06645 [Anaerolineales bacterium]